MNENYDFVFLDHLASGNPTPGGGSASAFTAAEASALVAMVARTTIGKKNYESVQNEIAKTVKNADAWRVELQNHVQRDAQAYHAIFQASRLPKNSPQEIDKRKESLQDSYLQAAEIPLAIAKIALKVMSTAVRLAAIANLNAVADAAAAVALAQAAITISSNNIKVNLKSLRENLRAVEILTEIREIGSHAEHLKLQMEGILTERGGIS